MSDNQASMDRPLRLAVAEARDAYVLAKTAYDECECEMPEGQRCVHYNAMHDAEAVVDAACAALRDSDEPRDWILREEGYDYATIEAASAEEALEEARDNVDIANYPGFDGEARTSTIWVSVNVRCEETDEEDSATVQCDPDEPECEGTAHDWQSPYDLLGGLKENPGVQGHGGGVVIEEVCMRCGCARITDTWAQNPETGEQGLEGVSYEPEKYADALEEKRLAAQREEVIALLNEHVSDADDLEHTLNVFVIACDDMEEAEDLLENLRRALPEGWACGYSGKKDKDGTDSSEVVVEPA